MNDKLAKELIEAIKELTDVMAEIRDIQDSWEDDEIEPDYDNTDKYIL